MTINLAELRARLETIELKRGAHESAEVGMCAMECVAWLAGEKHSDHPQCACPALGVYCRSLNDRLNGTDRQRLKDYLPRLLGTNDGKSVQRGRLLAHRSAAVILPLLLDLHEMTELSTKLRAVKFGDWDEVRRLSKEARDGLYRRRDESWKKYKAAAYTAAAYAAAAADAAYAAYAAAAAAGAAAAAAAAYAAYAAYAADAAKTRAQDARQQIISEALKSLDEALSI